MQINIEDAAIRKLLWKQKNIPFIFATFLLMIIIGTLGYSLAGYSSFKAGFLEYALIAGGSSFLYRYFYRNLAKNLSEGDLEKAKREIIQKSAHRPPTGKRLLKIIAIAVVIFIIILVVVITTSINSTN